MNEIYDNPNPLKTLLARVVPILKRPLVIAGLVVFLILIIVLSMFTKPRHNNAVIGEVGSTSLSASNDPSNLNVTVDGGQTQIDHTGVANDDEYLGFNDDETVSESDDSDKQEDSSDDDSKPSKRRKKAKAKQKNAGNGILGFKGMEWSRNPCH